ncbi:MAG: 4a-hydroxytetrahydrobiopterin dehydratase [Gemmatimonadota bacterium]|nr:MAG: 4a-hydroxytetrahydrobiopterin dehydratase [Gemmatimonadota bacterium]
MALLSDSEIQDRLASLQGWAREGNAIVKRYEFADFVEAIGFVRRVADRAEAARHHPDITINYNKVILVLSTHSEGGITERDISAALSFDGAVG